MKTLLLLAVVLCPALIPMPAGAQKASVFKYHSHQPYDKVYVDTLEAVSAARFIVREETGSKGLLTLN